MLRRRYGKNVENTHRRLEDGYGALGIALSGPGNRQSLLQLHERALQRNSGNYSSCMMWSCWRLYLSYGSSRCRRLHRLPTAWRSHEAAGGQTASPIGRRRHPALAKALIFFFVTKLTKTLGDWGLWLSIEVVGDIVAKMYLQFGVLHGLGNREIVCVRYPWHAHNASCTSICYHLQPIVLAPCVS